MKLLVIAASCLALAACGRAERGYTPEHQRNFTLGCAAGSAEAEALCACIWEKIEAEVPRPDFESLDHAPRAERAAHPVAQRISAFAAQCRAGAE